MIERIVLENFQSHAMTVLDLHPGVNAIIGPSDSGKTAIMRGIRWAKDNRPSGTANVRDAIVKEDGEIDDGAGEDFIRSAVEIHKENAIIVRERFHKGNRYLLMPPGPIIGEEDVLDPMEAADIFEAMGTTVPPAVSEALNFSDTTIQAQMEVPFLLGESSAKVAQFFNRIVKLDIIDRSLQNAENRRRKSNASKKDLEKRIAGFDKDLEALAWVGKAQQEEIKIRNVRDRLVSTTKAIDELTGSIARIEESEKQILSYAYVDKAESILIQVKERDRAADETFEDLKVLKSAIGEIEEWETYLQKTSQISRLSEILDESSQISDEIRVNERDSYNIESSIEAWEKAEIFQKNAKSLEKLQKIVEEITDLKAKCVVSFADSVSLGKTLASIEDARADQVAADRSIVEAENKLADAIEEIGNICPDCGGEIDAKGVHIHV